MASNLGDQVSLAFQFIASFCWAIGAILAEPASLADFLQLGAAVAWCIGNFAAAFSMGCSNKSDREGKKKVVTSSQRELLETDYTNPAYVNGDDSAKKGDLELAA